MKLGYVRITDLGVARIWKPENASDTSGTPGYMGKSRFVKNDNDKLQHLQLAPEVMCRQNHGVAVDYFAVGVIAFEFMFGRVIPNNNHSWVLN